MGSPRKRSVPMKYAMCRVYQHSWEYADVQRDGLVYLQSLVCMRCRTVKYVRIDARNGDAKGRHYTYPEGYLLEGGPMKAQERSAIRLAEVKANVKGEE